MEQTQRAENYDLLSREPMFMSNLPRTTVLLIATLLGATFLAPQSVMAVKSVGDLKKVESQVQKLVEKTLRCTVCVVSAGGGGSGSGVIVSEDGLVLTAAHVTQAAGDNLFVLFPDGRRAKAKALGANSQRDAGMVQITEPGPYPFVKIGKSKDLERNDWCVSLGHAGGFQDDRTPPVRIGRVLGNGRFVVTDCTIIGGDSGGPLFDLEGRVIGIHSNIGESLSQNQHVPVDVFIDDWDRMKKGEIWGQPLSGSDSRKLIIGVQLSPEQNDNGVVLAGITENSPAKRAGLKIGDIIAKINGKKMKSALDIVSLVSSKRPNEKIKLEVIRDDEKKDFELRLIRVGDLQRERPQRGRRPGQRRRRPRPESEDDQAGDAESKEKDKTKDADEPKEKDSTPEASDEKTTGKESDDKKMAAKPAAEEKEKPAADEKDGKKRSAEELIREARRSGGRLNWSREERERVEKFVQERVRNQGAPDDWYPKVMQAYEPVVAIASDSTYRVLVNGEQVALGTAVTESTLLTKASEIGESDFRVEVKKGERADGKVLTVFKQYDLALIEIKQSNLKPIDLSSKEKEMPLGTFLASVGRSKKPSAIGLISVKTRKLASSKGFLGIYLDKTDDGIVIRDVQRRSPAENAGLRVNDIIVKLDGKKYSELEKLIGAVGSHLPNEDVQMLVRRNGKEIEISAKLGMRTANPRSRIERMNQMGSELSDTRSGFPLALQHDCPIDPDACGGPLVNLDGDVVGINIARAGRIKSYALPTHVVQELLVEFNAKQKEQVPVAAE